MIVTVFCREYVVTPDEIQRAFEMLEVSSEAGRLHDMVSSLVSLRQCEQCGVKWLSAEAESCPKCSHSPSPTTETTE